ncbi:MAG: hypothetical protein ACI8RD_001643 [Bacillariaceae sp.]|jgi:hypothetical protein
MINYNNKQCIVFYIQSCFRLNTYTQLVLIYMQVLQVV